MTIWMDADRPSGWNEGDFGSFVAHHHWRFARTMPRNPHEYTLRKDANSSIFDAAVRFIREHGEIEFFQGKPFKMFYFREHKFWTMGAPVGETVLINRKDRSIP